MSEKINENYVKKCFDAMYEEQLKQVDVWADPEFDSNVAQGYQVLEEREKKLTEFQVSRLDGVTETGFLEDVQKLPDEFQDLIQALSVAKKDMDRERHLE